MSRSVPILARAVLIAFAIALEALVAYALVTAPPANLTALFGSGVGIVALAVHMLASALLAAAFGGFLPGGSASDRASVVVLYFIVSFILPGAGIAGVALLGAILSRGGKEAEGDSPFIVGNPLLDDDDGRRDAAMPAPHLEPLGRSLRSFETAQVRSAVLALRDRAGRRDAMALLKRFRSDPDSELQFFAGSALTGAVERAESLAAALTARIADDSEDASARAGLAESLIAAAGVASTVADRKRIAAAALEHLAKARELWPASWRLANMTARAHLQAGDTIAAGSVLGDEPGTSAEWLEILFRERRWDQLAEFAEAGVEVAPELRNALAFCGGKEEKGAVA